MRQDPLSQKTDWASVLLFGALVIAGWLNIYAAEYDPEIDQSIFDFGTSAGRQFIWILTSVVIAFTIFFFDYKFFDSFAYVIYGIIMAMLLFILIGGKEVAGSKSWLGIGGFGLQPSEFAKFAAALALAKYLSHSTRKLTDLNTLGVCFLIILLPMAMTILQGDTGTALVFTSLVVPMFREGMSPLLLIIAVSILLVFLLTLLISQTVLLVGIAIVTLLALGLNARNPKKLVYIIVSSIIVTFAVRSVDFILTDVLKPHQQKRVLSLVNPNIDPLGAGWNVTQSKIAIGSGGLIGKGFLEGTQTKFDFVPEQTTDFIFCTIGEEHGYLGSIIMLGLFTALLLRLVVLAERQKSTFSRVFGYGVVGIIFFHFTVNIAMTIGLFPVIGIPLPFFSYGGSSLWAFTILLFSFLKMDAHRMQVLQRL
ncbi:rod shape determining protein RodA [Ekhidna lutea]|uniref:Cell wall polymerase n=1 Tax=Ekhidna lutea TaxID=447679 RepID=A0A239EUE8_EKHLU|nr:rod shape-determining protein RodA [Ekhidna lutea]SNS48229.1 rod shape determining protein RodA [Ekhidna lutea]